MLLLRAWMCSSGSCRDGQSSGLRAPVGLVLCPQPLPSPKAMLKKTKQEHSKNKKELQVLKPMVCGPHCSGRDLSASTSPPGGGRENVGRTGNRAGKGHRPLRK